MEEKNFYEVDYIKDRRKANGRYEYLIKWKDYGDEECTWEPLSHLVFMKELVEKFDNDYENGNLPENLRKEKNDVDVNDRINENEQREKNLELNDEKEIENIINNVKNKRKRINLGRKRNKEELKKKMENFKDIKMKKLEENEKDIALYKIDEKLEKILAVKSEKNKLIAIVQKRAKNGNLYKEIMSTADVKIANPFILIDYYHSKIKFI